MGWIVPLAADTPSTTARASTRHVSSRDILWVGGSGRNRPSTPRAIANRYPNPAGRGVGTTTGGDQWAVHAARIPRRSGAPRKCTGRNCARTRAPPRGMPSHGVFLRVGGIRSAPRGMPLGRDEGHPQPEHASGKDGMKAKNADAGGKARVIARESEGYCEGKQTT